MAEAGADGIAELQARMQRKRRTVQPPRNPPQRPVDSSDSSPVSPAPLPPPEAQLGDDTTAADLVATLPDEPVGERYVTPSLPASVVTSRPGTRPDEPSANLAIRVRRSLDERLADLVHELRKSGVRTSKVELVELLLWELPPVPDDDFKARLTTFRKYAPRDTLGT